MEPSVPSRMQEQAEERHHGIRMLAKTLLRELLSSGYSAAHVVKLASELLGLLTESIRGSNDRKAAAVESGEVSL
jgi:hypothetical protein